MLPYFRNKYVYTIYGMFSSSNPLVKKEPEPDAIVYNNLQCDIRNLKVLNDLQMQFIKTLSHEYKNILFEIYNQCIQLFNELMKE
jgi:hypothetical protein